MTIPVLMLAAAVWLPSCNRNEGFFKLDASLQEQSFGCLGGRASVPVNTNTSFTVNVASGNEWIHPIIPGMSVTLVVDALPEGGQDRVGMVDIVTGAGTKSVTVRQNAVSWDSVPEKVRLNNTAVTFSATISSSRRIRFDMPDWVTPVDTAWTSGQKTYRFSAGVYLDPYTFTRSGIVKAYTADGGSTMAREISVEQSAYRNTAVQTIAELWKTDPIGIPSTSSERYDLLREIENYCNECDREIFRDTYLDAGGEAAGKLEEEYAILSIYRYVFDSVMESVRNAVVEEGTTRIWMLYNSGFIFKTPTQCWGMDINHRYAVLLEPLLDFITVSHSDADHVDKPLMDAMSSKGKPVISNFYTGSSSWCSTTPATYRIGNISIKTAITDENDSEPDCMTVVRLNTGADGGNLDLVHIGDSNCKPAQFGPVAGDADVMILRGISAANEVRVLAEDSQARIRPDNIIFSHQEELRHYVGKSPMRAPILGTLSLARPYFRYYAQTLSLPFWGTQLVWDGTSLKKFEE